MTNRVLRNVLYLPPFVILIYHMRQNRALLKDHRSHSVVLASRCLLIPLFMILSRNSAIQLRLSLRLLSLQLLRATTRALQKTVLKTLILV